MNELVTLIILAFCLSTDAFAVAVTNGMCSRNITKQNAFATAYTFGLFQGAMPALGYALGCTFSEGISRFQHWAALILLSFIGINMITDAVKEYRHPEEVCVPKNIFTFKNIILQGIATSIDALAAGVSLTVMDVSILEAAILIGVITFVCCYIGVYIGKRFGSLLGLRARLIGGIILIIIGLKIFLEHQL